MEESVFANAISFGLGAPVIGALYKGDEFISEEARIFLSQKIKGWRPGSLVDNRDLNTFTEIFDRIFGPNPARPRFIFATLISSALSVVVFFAAFLVIRPGAWEGFFDTDPITGPLRREFFAEQLLGTTLFVNFIVDYSCLTYCRTVIGRVSQKWSWFSIPMVLMRDIIGKVFYFVATMVLFYAASASLGGAFNGDSVLAVKALMPTLLGGLRMDNLSGVYIYASLISSFWLWSYLLSSVVIRGAQSLPILWQFLVWALPFDKKPVRALGVIAGTLLTLAFIIWIELLKRLAH